MNERLLQFIWQFQYFNTGELASSQGEKIQIIIPGQPNHNQGPDFLDAKIKINTTTWAGNIELHLSTSDWQKHQHQYDKNYKNVILHVVWENDLAESAPSIPILELKTRVSNMLIAKYETIMKSRGFIPCEKIIDSVKELTLNSWMERLLAERLTRKSQIVETNLKKTKHHWEETFWWMLARNFGIKVNAEAFEQIAKNIPLNLLAKHKNQIHQVEALLFGIGGMLDKNFEEDYPKLLKKEFDFLKKKYQLKKIHQPVFFLRMRPENFPTIRLAQLAVLITESSHLFSKIKEAESLARVKTCFAVTANDYWHYHYKPDVISGFKKKKIGMSMIDNIIINCICPLLFAYGHYHSEIKYKDKAIQWLEEISAEKNSITKGFQSLGLKIRNAADAQALIELKNEYCNKKRCLDCAVGNAILKY